MVSPATPEGNEGQAISNTQGSKAHEAESRGAVWQGAGELGEGGLGRTRYGRAQFYMVDVPPTLKQVGCKERWY